MKSWLLVFAFLFSTTVFAQHSTESLSSPASLNDRIRIIQAEKQRLQNLIHSFGLKEETRSSRLFGKDCGETTIIVKDDDDEEHGISSPNCTWRRGDGTCITYGEDVAGKKCVPNCTWRRGDGTCITYGEDICN